MAGYIHYFSKTRLGKKKLLRDTNKHDYGSETGLKIREQQTVWQKPRDSQSKGSHILTRQK